ncbi:MULTISPECIES: hypothetical protein [unclassified Thiocapsa]|uniref:hypothetical protein n=1 Tax=unclassified Thiocapsa TaxID=2641286 RepID=UPI0035B1F07E
MSIRLGSKADGEAFFDRAHERLSEAPVLLLVDDVSVFVEKALARDQPDTARLLAWLRAWPMRLAKRRGSLNRRPNRRGLRRWPLDLLLDGLRPAE